MRRDRFAAAPILLGIGMAVAALLGPLMLDVIQYRNSPAAVRQLQGGEVISLLAAAPLAIASGLVWNRRRTLAAALAMGPGLYAVYMYVQYVLAGQYDRYAGNVERFFPLFLTLIILGWITALRAWSALSGAAGAVPMPARRVRRALGGLLLAIGLLFAAAWVGSIAGAVGVGPTPAGYGEDPNLFWLIRLMDLGFVIPAALVTAYGLLRNRAWAARLSYAIIGMQMLLTGAVCGMAVMMQARHDPGASPVLLVATAAGTAGFAAIFIVMVRHVAGRGPS